MWLQVFDLVLRLYFFLSHPCCACLYSAMLCMWLQVFDLVLRLDPASELSHTVRTEMEAHLSTGAPMEAFM